MSTSYSIYLANKYGETNTYGFFTSPPVSEASMTEVYSNVWISQKLAEDQNIQVKIDKNYYACTFYMYNLDSQPAFRTKEDATADPGCYEIVSGDDFSPNLNFLMGMAAPDFEGRMVAVASFEAPRNSMVNIQPHADYYISAFGTSEGTVINFKEQSRVAAHIDFTNNPGKYGAIVTHDEKGDFDVQYVDNRDEYLELIERRKEGSTLEQKVSKLEKQLSTVLKYLPAASAAECKLSQAVPKKANGY